MIYVGIDDTDVLGSPGTNKLARWLIDRLAPRYRSLLAIRHQLLFDPRVPYTSKNSSASLLFEDGGAGSLDLLAKELRHLMQEWFIEGSDPGLCLTRHVPPEITAFGVRCQQEVVHQRDARALAAKWEILLDGLGGTNDGVIGALAAVGLAADGNDGRVVSIAGAPDDLADWQEIAVLHRRGVDEVCCEATGSVHHHGRVDVGKHLRPSFRDGRVVLFVEQTDDGLRAVRKP